VVSLSPYRQVLGQDLKLGHDRFFPYPFQFIIYLSVENSARKCLQNPAFLLSSDIKRIPRETVLSALREKDCLCGPIYQPRALDIMKLLDLLGSPKEQKI
jgi:hypothetical protein